jgi:uncharacterized protein YggU (UPF0235/DUF167 family)
MKIFVKVKTGRKKEEVKKIDDNHYSVSVKERPQEGRANKAVVGALADYFGAEAKMVSGFKSKKNIEEIIKN